MTTATINNTFDALNSRRLTHQVGVGNIAVGGNAPIVIQAMTDTDTADDLLTAIQCAELAKAGAEIVRITINSPYAAKKVIEIRQRLDDMGHTVPLVGDFHYNGHKLLSQYPSCAKTLDKYRINPGNVDSSKNADDNFTMMINQAMQYGKSVRIGVNWGSLDQSLLAAMMDDNAKKDNPDASDVLMQRALVESALRSAELAENIGLAANKIILSCKTSRLQSLLAVYRQMANSCDYPLHLGLTEAGMGSRAKVATSAALSILLAEGIGDTIRASLTPAVGGDRCEEVKLCCDLLQSMEIRAFLPQVTSCPGCGRTTSVFFRQLAETIEQHIQKQRTLWQQQYKGVENLKIAVMGCIVNGPGESRHADIGISLPGSGENPVAPVYVDGKKITALKGDTIAEDFIELINNYVQKKYGAP